MGGLNYLLDSNVIAEPVRPHPNKNVLRRLEAHKGELCSASIVFHEILYGIFRLTDSKKKQYLTNYLRDAVQPAIQFFPYDHEAAVWHAKERARLEGMGKNPSFADGQIASIAYVNSLVVVTRNIDDFLNFDGLRVENWFV
ncbi:MAG TPA: type II toxin-antitoxin system VapC family toxin [Myxococcota bacterium]|nr:type II toxin-antitoxin system VapC family toxin [Myxococcota bacterium]